MSSSSQSSENGPNGRLAAVRAHLEQWDVEGVLIESAANRRWLSGFTGSAGSLLVTADKAWLITDSRYAVQASREAPDFVFFQDKRGKSSFANFIRGTGIAVIGIEAGKVTLSRFEGLQAIETVTWRPLSTTVDGLRQVKTAAEIDIIQAAAAITDGVMAAVPAIARPGMSEKELTWALEQRLREGGGDSFAFDPIVASGPNSALPHFRPGDRRFEAGEILLVDIGTRIDGYHSDMTRTFFLGAQPPDRFWQIYNTVLAAEEKAIAGLRAGATGKEIDDLARGHIGDAGFGDQFAHGLGHGVGLEIHEAPIIGPRLDGTIPALAVVTIEPGIYFPGWGGVRIEDLLLVTQHGAEALSKCPKDPVIRL